MRRQCGMAALDSVPVVVLMLKRYAQPSGMEAEHHFTKRPARWVDHEMLIAAVFVISMIALVI
jgi:hypothetical protein